MSSEIYSCLTKFFTQNCACFSVIGKIYVMYLAYKILSKVWYFAKLYFLSPTLGLAIDAKSFGKWAVVTGSTDGIGKSYAEQLAKKGMNLVLISRSAEKLHKVSSEIKEKFQSIEVKCIAVDFSQDMSIYNKIRDGLIGLDIGVLVNNVGMSYEHPAYLEECSDLMSKLILPHMIEKKKGLIINIASTSGHLACPLLTVYSASKAFVHLFSKGLREEYKDKGIIVQCVSPQFVATKMSKIRHSSFWIPDADTFARSALGTVGLGSDVAGCLPHELTLTGLNLVGESIVVNKFHQSMLTSRAKALAKKQKGQ